MINDLSNIQFDASDVAETSDDRLFKEMEYTCIIELIAKKRQIPFEEAMIDLKSLE